MEMDTVFGNARGSSLSDAFRDKPRNPETEALAGTALPPAADPLPRWRS